MTNHKQQKSARGVKCEDSVALGTNELFPKDIYALSTDAFGFIFNMERRLNINDETDQFLRNVFKGFRDEVQEKWLNAYATILRIIVEKDINICHCSALST